MKKGKSEYALISEDDFSAVGRIPYKPPSVAGKEMDLEKFDKNFRAIKKLYAAAARKRDKLNEARKKK